MDNISRMCRADFWKAFGAKYKEAYSAIYFMAGLDSFYLIDLSRNVYFKFYWLLKNDLRINLYRLCEDMQTDVLCLVTRIQHICSIDEYQFLMTRLAQRFSNKDDHIHNYIGFRIVDLDVVSQSWYHNRYLNDLKNTVEQLYQENMTHEQVDFIFK